MFPVCSYSFAEKRAAFRAVMLALEINCVLGESTVANGAQIGPWAHLRPGSQLGPDVVLLQEVGDNRGIHPPVDQAESLGTSKADDPVPRRRVLTMLRQKIGDVSDASLPADAKKRMKAALR